MVETGFDIPAESDAAGEPPLEHRPRVQPVAFKDAPVEPTLHSDDMSDGSWIATNDTVPATR